MTDLLIATEYDNGLSSDNWALGYVAETLDSGRYMIVDDYGTPINKRGFAAYRKIDKERADWIWNNRQEFSAAGVCIWDYVE